MSVLQSHTFMSFLQVKNSNGHAFFSFIYLFFKYNYYYCEVFSTTSEIRDVLPLIFHSLLLSSNLLNVVHDDDFSLSWKNMFLDCFCFHEKLFNCFLNLVNHKRIFVKLWRKINNGNAGCFIVRDEILFLGSDLDLGKKILHAAFLVLRFSSEVSNRYLSNSWSLMTTLPDGFWLSFCFLALIIC